MSPPALRTCAAAGRECPIHAAPPGHQPICTPRVCARRATVGCAEGEIGAASAARITSTDDPNLIVRSLFRHGIPARELQSIVPLCSENGSGRFRRWDTNTLSVPKSRNCMNGRREQTPRCNPHRFRPTPLARHRSRPTACCSDFVTAVIVRRASCPVLVFSKRPSALTPSRWFRSALDR